MPSCSRCGRGTAARGLYSPGELQRRSRRPPNDFRCGLIAGQWPADGTTGREEAVDFRTPEVDGPLPRRALPGEQEGQVGVEAKLPSRLAVRTTAGEAEEEAAIPADYCALTKRMGFPVRHYAIYSKNPPKKIQRKAKKYARHSEKKVIMHIPVIDNPVQEVIPNGICRWTYLML